MRTLILIIAFFLGSITTFSQTPLTQAVNFAGTDTEGVEHNLFEILAGGQYVCLDFFHTL